MEFCEHAAVWVNAGMKLLYEIKRDCPAVINPGSLFQLDLVSFQQIQQVKQQACALCPRTEAFRLEGLRREALHQT